MNKKACVFPGQGAQFVGMGKIYMMNIPKHDYYLNKQMRY